MIQVFKPSMTQEEIDAVVQVMKSGWIGLGPKTKEFEDEFAKFIGVKHVVGLNSATAGLHLAAKVLGIGPGDEVIVPDITFVSTAFAASYNGATPVFADVHEDTLNINVDDARSKVTERTKMIVPVHFGGEPADMDAIAELARERNLKIVEDAAHAAGAAYKGRKVGTIGDAGVFSFHAVKNIGTGDGGVIATNSDADDERLRKLRWCGINKSTFERSAGKSYSWYYDVDEVGWKFHMNDIVAAMALVQMRRLGETNKRRVEIAKAYIDGMSGLDWIEVPREREYYHNFVVKVDRRDEFMDFLAKRGVATGVHYMALHLHPVFKGFKADAPVAERVWKRLVTMPLYPDMTDADVAQVVQAVKDFGRENGL